MSASTAQTPATPASGQYANWFIRVIGYLIDDIAISIPVWIGVIIARTTTRDDGSMSGIGVTFYIIFGLISFGLWIYNRCIRSGRTGKSWGRQVMGTKLISLETGRPIGAGRAFLRDICHIIDTIICYIGWLFPIWDAKRQTIADKIMNTVVVRG